MQTRLETRIKEAEIQTDVIINNANATAEADKQKSQANMDAFYEVSTQQATAYATLKDTLGLTNEELIGYIKSKLIGEYVESDMVVHVPSRA